MKSFFRWALAFLAVLSIGLSVLFLLKEDLVKTVIEREIQSRSQLPVRIGHIKFDLRTHQFTAFDIRLARDPGTGTPLAWDIPKLSGEWDPDALKTNQLRLKWAEADLRMLRWTSSRPPTKTAATSISRNGSSSLAPPGSPTRGQVQFDRIDRLTIRLGKLEYLQPARPNESQSIDFQGAVRMISNVTSWQQLEDWLLELSLQHGISVPIR